MMSVSDYEDFTVEETQHFKRNSWLVNLWREGSCCRRVDKGGNCHNSMGSLMQRTWVAIGALTINLQNQSLQWT